ncbi:FAD-dependent oxidoreductase [Peribacillus simplex]|uniref:FAD-dependent oxidoreductase n=2 Tax=Peribacillus TaxID=2675229 RepID=A0AA90SLG8_9BACI|nr:MULTISPECIES: FAD-dependent oxidoreductase [Peribacillus]MDP1421790.1 FAD-dependent oxidoreductase [Peribacillus simplex]MDP1453086.1 FAD-dependent oxidoreductase [Peribacillus frigoritolerans]
MLSHSTSCCVVGGGPGGVMLALLLARKGIPVTLIEQHKSFNRSFRGEVFHSSIMEIVDELGLINKLFEIPHTKIYSAKIDSPHGSIVLDFTTLRSKFPHLTTMSQSQFLEFIVSEATKYDHFKYIMGAKVVELLNEDNKINGVKIQKDGEFHEIRSILTVAADGRNSTISKLSNVSPTELTKPIDIIWFRLPRHSTEPEYMFNRSNHSNQLNMLACVNRGDYWQIGMFIPKGSFKEIRIKGMENLHRALYELVPEFSDRISSLKNWDQLSVLSASSSRLKQWYLPNLLFIGDAAHTMSPLGAVGINYAIQDAVVVANVLSAPLKSGHVSLKDLARVQKQRELPTKIIQAYQGVMQKQIIDPILKDKNSSIGFKLVKRFNFLRKLIVILVTSGFKRVRVQ